MMAIFAGPCHKCEHTIEPKEEVILTDTGHAHKECPIEPVTVNDERSDWDWHMCWICGDPRNHSGVPHASATGDGLTRYTIVSLMNQGGYTWRPAE